MVGVLEMKMIDYFLQCKKCDARMIQQPRNSDAMVYVCRCRTFSILPKVLMVEPDEFMEMLKVEGIRGTIQVDGDTK